MYIPNYPEDSTLRRHYESAAEFQRQAWLAQPPSDSVLRRHYAQLQQSGPGRQAASATEEPPARTPASPSGSEKTDGGGLFGWLKGLFGG